MQRGELLIGEGSRTRYGARILFIGGESSASEYCGRNEQKIEAYASSKMRLKYYFNGSRGHPSLVAPARAYLSVEEAMAGFILISR